MVCTVHITSPELPPMTEQYTGHVIQTETRDNDNENQLYSLSSTITHQERTAGRGTVLNQEQNRSNWKKNELPFKI